MDPCEVTVLSPRVLADDGGERRMTEKERLQYDVAVCVVRAERAQSAALDERCRSLQPEIVSMADTTGGNVATDNNIIERDLATPG